MSVILLGLGRYVEEIVEVVSAISDVVLVERDEARLRAFLEKAPVASLRALPGSATDVGLWKEVDTRTAEAVISFLSVEATLDVARLLRKALGYRSKIVHVSKARPDPQAVRELDLEVVSIPEVLGAILRNLLQGQGIVRYPVGIGLRKGEVVEVLITESSPAVYARLRELRQPGARVALVYREGSPILPRADFRVQPGDRLLVVGDPRGVEIFVGAVIRGSPRFPGASGAWAPFAGRRTRRPFTSRSASRCGTGWRPARTRREWRRWGFSWPGTGTGCGGPSRKGTRFPPSTSGGPTPTGASSFPPTPRP